MPDFQYTAREMSGQEVTGVLTAATEQEAVSSLSARALFPVRIVAAPSIQARRSLFGRRITSGQLVNFYSQLADLLKSGVPLLRSLEILEQQPHRPALTEVLRDIREEVADGMRLAEAMRAHQRVFGELAVSMVRAGEEGSFLEDVLKQIAAFTEHQEEMKSRVLGALVYPLFLMGIGSIIVTGMLVFFVPKFQPIFERVAEQGGLPLPTVLLLGMSGFCQHYGLWVLAALIAGGWWIYRYAETAEGRRRLDILRLRAVGLGPIVRSLGIARFTRILGTLMKNGVPILLALRISKDATGNVLLSEAIGVAAENISAGKSLARPLGTCKEFPVDIVEMIAVGEEANNLEQVLLNIADNLEKRTYRQLDLFVRLLEPMMLLVMAVVILFVVIALLLPVFQSAGAL